MDERRSRDKDAIVFGDIWGATNEKRKQDLIRHFEKLDSSKTLKVLKVLRHENLAHLIFESRERKKSRGIDFDDHGLTRNRFFEFAKDTVHVIEKLELYRTGQGPRFDDMYETFTAYSDHFWNAVPVFREVE